jgi:hypothetical protein
MNIEKFDYPDGSRYEGETKDGKRHGQGTWTRPDGTRYVGMWKNDKPEGQGTISWPDGRKYVGEWKAGKRHGYGTDIHPDGHSLEGEWAEGEYVKEAEFRPVQGLKPEKGEPEPELKDESYREPKAQGYQAQHFKEPEPESHQESEAESYQESKAESFQEPEAESYQEQRFQEPEPESYRRAKTESYKEPEEGTSTSRETKSELQPTGKGFFAALFDIKMKEMITPKIIRLLYLLGLIGIGLGALGAFITSIFAVSQTGVGSLILAIVAIPIGAIVAVIFLRIYMELIILLFNIYDQLKEIGKSLKR